MTIDTNNIKLPGGGIHHIAVQTYDWEASIRLYRDVLGMRVVNEFARPERRIALLYIGDGSHIELIAPTDAAPPTGGQAANNPLLHIALTTTDVRRVIERVRSAGYEITIEPKDVQLGPTGATIAFFKGPNAEVIEFFQTN